MKCPTCSAWSDVRESRQLTSGFIVRRRRKCANGHSFSTYEFHVADPATGRAGTEASLRARLGLAPIGQSATIR